MLESGVGVSVRRALWTSACARVSMKPTAARSLFTQASL
jgi:hypothetical protein